MSPFRVFRRSFDPVMAIRVKGIVALILCLTFIFLTINAFLPREQESHFSVVQGEEGSLDDFKADDLPTGGRNGLLSFMNHPDEQAPGPATSEWDVDPRIQSTQHSTYEIVNESSSEHPNSTSRNDDFRLLIGVMSPQWSSSRRYFIRHAYAQFPQNLPVDVVFVQGDAPTWNPINADKVAAAHRTQMLWENNTYHDIMHLDCEENLEEGKTYEYFKKVGLEFSHKYTHVMKTDDDSFVNIPGISNFANLSLISALVQVIQEHKDEEHFYWGTTYKDVSWPSEMWGSGYILSMDIVKWISTSEIPISNQVGLEDLQVMEWIVDGRFDDHFVINSTAFAGYPWPEIGDRESKLENEIRPFERWTLVTHPLKEDFMWIDTAEYYLSLEW